MKPDEFINIVLKAHENNDNSPIDLGGDLVIQPMPNYTGKMAREAFYGGMRYLNKGRKYAGLFDFKIIFRGKPVSHKPDIIMPAVTHLPIHAVRCIHQGVDPVSIKGLDNQQIALACCIQAAFAEQEINWGEEVFQQRTYFGRVDMEQQILCESAPRDFQMVFIERCVEESRKSGRSPKDIVDEIAILVKTVKSGKNVMLPLTKAKQHKKQVLPDFEPHMPRVLCGRPIEKWINPHRADAIRIAKKFIENPFYTE